jgi:hypothetical protein
LPSVTLVSEGVMLVFFHLMVLLFSLLRLTDAPPAGDPPASDPPPPERDADGDQDVTKLKEALRKERDARKALEKEVTPLRQFRDDRAKAEQTETERLQARIKELETKEADLSRRERTMLVRDAVTPATDAEGLQLRASVGTVLKLLDLDAVEFDDDGTPKNLRVLLKALYKDEPSLVAEKPKRPGSADASSTSRSSPEMIGSGMERLRMAYADTERRR